MTLRLPDFYYTTKMLDGTNAQMWPKQEGLSFNQGEECRFTTYLNMFGQPFDTSKWDLRVVVKKNNWAERLMWAGGLANGIFPVEGVPGYFEIWMPSLVTRYLKPGAYHFGFQAVERVGATNSVWDSTISLREDIIQILRSTDMPNPVQDPTNEIFTRFNPETGAWEYGVGVLEKTVPISVPVLNIGTDSGSTPNAVSQADGVNATVVTESGGETVVTE